MQPPLPSSPPSPPSPFSLISHLGPKRLENLLVGLLLNGRRVARLAAEHELRVELPRRGDTPRLGDLGVDEGVVVLEVGAGTFGGEGGPQVEFLCSLSVRCSILNYRNGRMLGILGWWFLFWRWGGAGGGGPTSMPEDWLAQGANLSL